MAEGGMPSLESQKTEIANLLQKSLKNGDSWFLLDIRWFKVWKKYVGFDTWDTMNIGSEEYHPGPIDNSSLFKGIGKAKMTKKKKLSTRRNLKMGNFISGDKNDKEFTAPKVTEETRFDVGHSTGEETCENAPIDAVASDSVVHKDETGTEFGHAIRPQLKEQLVNELDYVLLPEEAWIKMVAWYSLVQNQEPIERFVIEQGMFVKHCKVEVYLMDLKLCENSDINTVTTHQFSQQSTIGDLEIVMRRLFGVNERTDVRLWNRYMSNTYEHLNKKENSLQEARLYQGQVVVLEQRNADGTWPRGGKENGKYYVSDSSANVKECKQVKCDSVAAKISENTDFECPVCHDDYDRPKSLPCKHTACHKCILTWLQKGGRKSGCPLCRVPILSPSTGGGDLKVLVDALPVDLSVEILMQNQDLLKGPQYCAMCPNITAIAYCVCCGIKLCEACAKYHQKLPLTKDHHLTQLTLLTTKQPVSFVPSKCPSHQDKPVEFYCCGHHQVICKLCTASHHNMCEVKPLAAVAQEKRDILKQQAQKLKTMAADMDQKLKNIQVKHQGEAKLVFDELQHCIRNRHKKINALIETEVESARKAHKQDKTAILFHTGVLNSLAVLSPDVAVVEMMQKMESENYALQHLTERINEPNDQVDLKFDSQTLSQLKTAIASVGIVGLPTQTGASPSTSDTA